MILASLKPYYYYLIGEKKKNIEVRKSALKDLPQDIVFYMSKDEKSFAKIPKEFQAKYREHFGKVGMKVVCDKVDEYNFHEGLTEFNSMGLPSRIYGSYLIFTDDYKKMCLSYDDVKAYGNRKTIYGWYLDNVEVYDKPKELSEFTSTRVCGNYKDLPAYIHVGCNTCKYSYTINCMIKCRIGGRKPLTRPPQSYMQVEELKEV